MILRDVSEDDLSIFFEQQSDPSANFMAAFTAKDPLDRRAFMEKWKTTILGDESVIKKTILWEGKVAGTIAKYEMAGQAHLMYWIGKEFWGLGISTMALTHFLKIIEQRPLFAHTAFDNAGSMRVLEKCGFVRIDKVVSFANGRGTEIEEIIWKLDSDS